MWTDMKTPLEIIHVLGHPDKPLDIVANPQDAQVFACWNFCMLLEHLEIPYVYYGTKGSVLPPGGRGIYADLGKNGGNWHYGNAWHKTYTKRLNRALKKHVLPAEHPQLLASLYGAAQCDIADFGLPVMEPMAGYGHCWAPFRVFPSQAQMHAIYTAQEELTRQTRFFDAVIPHFLNEDDYRPAENPGDYLLYLGRDVADKGISIAQEVADAMNIELVKVHSGCFGKAKTQLLGEALAVMCPTCYVEPFGYVAIEAQMCGTPVISTDWGAFVETVEQGKTGFRCRTQAEFKRAVQLVPQLNRKTIRQRAIALYSIKAVAPAYLSYFNFVWNVWSNGGFYAEDAFVNDNIWNA